MNALESSYLHRIEARCAWLALAVCACACSDARPRREPEPVYTGDIAPLLDKHCAECHRGDDAGEGFVVSSYLDTLSCPHDMPHTSAVARVDGGAQLSDVLERPDHAGLLDGAERIRLRAWIAAGAPLREDGVHAPGILNPHSRDWHGRLAARDHFAPITSPTDPDVCGRCHDGAPVRPAGVTLAAPGAPACTSCHDQARGVLACGTCHGDGAGRAYPPRDRCLFPASKPSSHRAHVESTRLSSTKLECTSCHPAPDANLRGTHADGRVQMVFDPALAGDDAHYDPVTGVCAVRCHNQGGARALPRFSEQGPLVCGDCHGAPPDNHYAGACDRCHHDTNAGGDALSSVALHMNGEVNLGDNSRGCAACHGKDGDPMPPTPSHQLHRASVLTAAIDCSDCHVMPATVTSPGHLDLGNATPADITFGARAQARGRHPTYEGGTCKDIACHGAGLAEGIERALRWDAPAAPSCTACHGAPPSKNHPADSGCASLICHGNEVTAGDPKITELGRSLHIDGTIETGPR